MKLRHLSYLLILSALALAQTYPKNYLLRKAAANAPALLTDYDSAAQPLDSAEVRAIVHDTSLAIRADFPDSVRAAHIADTAKRAGWAPLDSVRVRAIVKDTATALRAYTLARVSDTATVLRTNLADTSSTLRALIAAREPALGNPSSNGQALVSTTAGVRSWASMQPLDADLTSIAALTTQPYGRSLLTQVNAPTARSTLGATDTVRVRAIVRDTATGLRVSIATKVDKSVSRVQLGTYVNPATDSMSLASRHASGIGTHFGRWLNIPEAPKPGYFNFLMMPEAATAYAHNTIALPNAGALAAYIGRGTTTGSESWARLWSTSDFDSTRVAAWDAAAPLANAVVKNPTATQRISGYALEVERAIPYGASFSARMTGDSQTRIAMLADGSITFGSGAASADVNLYRSGNGVLKFAGTQNIGMYPSRGILLNPVGSSDRSPRIDFDEGEVGYTWSVESYFGALRFVRNYNTTPVSYLDIGPAGNIKAASLSGTGNRLTQSSSNGTQSASIPVPSAYIQTLLDDADAATARSTLGAGTGNGTVTSVALTPPANMSVSGSPVTTSGTLGLAWNGSASNLVRADGSTVASSGFLSYSGASFAPYEIPRYYNGAIEPSGIISQPSLFKVINKQTTLRTSGEAGSLGLSISNTSDGVAGRYVSITNSDTSVTKFCVRSFSIDASSMPIVEITINTNDSAQTLIYAGTYTNNWRLRADGSTSQSSHINTYGVYKKNGTQVVGARQTGMGTTLPAATIGGTYNSTTQAQIQALYNKVILLEAKLKAHGLIAD